MDNSQEMTTPLNRFFTFWWILAGFAVFGVLALVAYLVSGGSNDDTAVRSDDVNLDESNQILTADMATTDHTNQFENEIQSNQTLELDA